MKFCIITDCKAIQLTMQKKELYPRIARWALILEEYNAKVQHRPGERMKYVDALSRYPATTMSIETGLKTRINKAQQLDENCSLILKKDSYKKYCTKNGILYKFVNGNNVLVILKAMENELITSIHERGHINARKVETLIKQDYYMDNLDIKVKHNIAS